MKWFEADVYGSFGHEGVFVHAKNKKDAEKNISKAYSSNATEIKIGTDYDTYSTARAVWPKIKIVIDSRGLLNKSEIKKLKLMGESMNVHYPALKKLVNLQYTDPRTKDGCSIVAEKCGKFKVKKESEAIDGSYIMYEDSEMKGKYIAVHVSDAINEESGEATINVIAIGNKQSVRERMGYRMRRNKNVNERNDSKAISSLFDDKQWKKMIGFSTMPKEKQKELMDDFKKYKKTNK